MEALTPAFAEEANCTRVVPPAETEGYLSQRDMRQLIQAALNCGWKLVPYEADLSRKPPGLVRLSQEETNWREEEQARRLRDAIASLADDAKLFVWCGNGHLTKVPVQDWYPMGYRFQRLAGIAPFAIDQLRTVEFGQGHVVPWARWASAHDSVLESFGRTAGFLSEEEPADWPTRRRRDVDAFLLSTENTLT